MLVINYSKYYRFQHRNYSYRYQYDSVKQGKKINHMFLREINERSILKRKKNIERYANRSNRILMKFQDCSFVLFQTKIELLRITRLTIRLY